MEPDTKTQAGQTQAGQTQAGQTQAGQTQAGELVWLNGLLAEAKAFDHTMLPPAVEVKKGERVIGDCPEEAKSFYALGRYFARECKRIKLESGFQVDGISDEEHARFNQMDEKEDALMEIFWGTVRHALNSWGVSLGARAGWKIVQIPEQESPVEKLLGKIMGQQ